MSRRRVSPGEMLRSAAELGPDDGVDPKEFFRKGGSRRQVGRKTAQLCSQVAEALHWALSTGCSDDVLQSLAVASVEPAPHSGRVLVTVVAPADLDREVVAARLDAAAGLLRTEVAAHVHRRKVPELTFRVVPG